MSTYGFKLVELARWSGRGRSRVTQWKNEGMPTDTIENAKAWVEQNYPDAGGSGGEKNLSSTAGKGATKTKRPTKAKLRDAGLEGSHARAVVMELDAYEHYLDGVGENLSNTEILTRLKRYHEAADLRLKREKQLDALLKSRGEVAPVSELKNMISEALLPLDKRLSSMPPELAHMVNPGDPEHAERELEAWRDDVKRQLRGESE